jgi:vitamin K-dependent gamma-carboxylase
MKNFFFKPIDNAPLIVFRILFGALVAAESFGAIATGWVKEVLINPEFTFSHIGFEWIQPLPGYGMYFYFATMGVLGLLMMIGYKYRLSAFLFAILWLVVYLMQKSAYNNHYYLLALVAFIMVILPAHRYASFDAKQNVAIKKLTMPRWISLFMIALICIVYFYATVAKFYPDWLDGTVTRNLFSSKKEYPIVGFLFDKHWFHLFIAYAGIGFDGLVVPLLLWSRTRTIALLASLFFHLFNAVIIQIGIFPFFALSFILFFYNPKTIRKIFLRKKPEISVNNEHDFELKSAFLYLLIPFFVVQLLLPLRHNFIEGNVFWTEEAHRHSWRMMLRSRWGTATFNVVDKKTGEILPQYNTEKLSKKQLRSLNTKGDFMWQMAQRIKKEYALKNIDVSVYIDAKVSLNGKPMLQYTNPSIDIAATKWKQWSHNEWIVLYSNEVLFAKK